MDVANGFVDRYLCIACLCLLLFLLVIHFPGFLRQNKEKCNLDEEKQQQQH